MSFQIKKVVSKKDIRNFHELPDRLNEGNAWYRPPFRSQLEQIFDPESNERFAKGGCCERFLVIRYGQSNVKEGEVVGRFAVFSDPEKDQVYDPPLGGIGFIESENDPAIMDEIINHAGEWHREQGNAGFRGPVNFGENDTYWGILIDGFKDSNVYGMLYHPEYYEALIEHTKPEKFDDVYMYQRAMSDPLPDRMLRILERVESRPEVDIRPVDADRLREDGEIIRTIYNRAFNRQVVQEREEEFIGITEATVSRMIQKLKPVLMPETSPIVFVNGEPASFLISVPDLYEISAKTKGNWRWWHLPMLLGFRKRAHKFRPLAFGTDPKYRGQGLESLVFLKGMEWTRSTYPNLKVLEGGFVSEKNWIMRRNMEALGCHIAKTYRIYKWMI